MGPLKQGSRAVYQKIRHSSGAFLFSMIGPCRHSKVIAPLLFRSEIVISLCSHMVLLESSFTANYWPGVRTAAFQALFSPMCLQVVCLHAELF